MSFKLEEIEIKNLDHLGIVARVNALKFYIIKNSRKSEVNLIY